MAAHRFWRRWFVWTTAGEAVGFALPAVVGATTWDAPGGVALVVLVAAGRSRAPSWVLATALAWLVGLAVLPAVVTPLRDDDRALAVTVLVASVLGC